MAEERVHTVGRRKSAVARVWIKPGKGTITVNRKPIEQYMARETDRILIRQPLTITDNLERFDISVTVRGGGISGQAGAISHGMASQGKFTAAAQSDRVQHRVRVERSIYPEDGLEIIAGLRRSHSQLRLVVVRTESGALMLDDSYNASPESTLAALNLLEEIEGRKVAVLGDMLELGYASEAFHREVGAALGAYTFDLIMTVGPMSRFMVDAALAAAIENLTLPSGRSEYCLQGRWRP